MGKAGKGRCLALSKDIRTCREVYELQFTEGVFNTGDGVRLIRCSHADAAESGAGGGGVRRRGVEASCRGGA